jgi:glycosyltransferase involved in cell wall biosynthesis
LSAGEPEVIVGGDFLAVFSRKYGTRDKVPGDMRIAINCSSFLKKQSTGIGRYAYHLVKGLADVDRENIYHLYARKGLFSFKKRLPCFHARNIVARVDWFSRGPEKILKNIDLYHLPSPGPLGSPEGAGLIVTVHDVIFKAFPEGHTPQTLEAGEQQYQDICNKAVKVICCSRSTVNDLKKYFDVPESKVVLVYQGVDREMFYPMGDEEKHLARRVLQRRGVEGPYLLSVGTIEPRKNLTRLIQAFHHLKMKKRFAGKLAVIGMKGWMSEDIAALIEKLGLTRHINFLGYLPDRELRYFYNLAEAFVFPSLYEGFGFPIVEAFSCGVPVVTSNVSSCPEIAGAAALMVDPRSPEDIAAAVARIIDDPRLRQDLRERGIKRAGDFNFGKTARETLGVYQEVYQGPRRG